MYNILILMLATYFIFLKKKKKKKGVGERGTKSPQQCAGISLQSLQFFVSALDLGVQWEQRGNEFMLVDFKSDYAY